MSIAAIEFDDLKFFLGFWQRTTTAEQFYVIWIVFGHVENCGGVSSWSI